MAFYSPSRIDVPLPAWSTSRLTQIADSQAPSHEVWCPFSAPSSENLLPGIKTRVMRRSSSSTDGDAKPSCPKARPRLSVSSTICPPLPDSRRIGAVYDGQDGQTWLEMRTSRFRSRLHESSLRFHLQTTRQQSVSCLLWAADRSPRSFEDGRWGLLIAREQPAIPVADRSCNRGDPWVSAETASGWCSRHAMPYGTACPFHHGRSGCVHDVFATLHPRLRDNGRWPKPDGRTPAALLRSPK